ncbi:formate--tetrahydrofolate ligase, partial [Halobium palmae]
MTTQDEGEDPIPTDYEIAQDAEMDPIGELAEDWGLGDDDLQLYGDYTAKVDADAI